VCVCVGSACEHRNALIFYGFIVGRFVRIQYSDYECCIQAEDKTKKEPVFRSKDEVLEQRREMRCRSSIKVSRTLQGNGNQCTTTMETGGIPFCMQFAKPLLDPANEAQVRQFKVDEEKDLVMSVDLVLRNIVFGGSKPNQEASAKERNGKRIRLVKFSRTRSSTRNARYKRHEIHRQMEWQPQCSSRRSEHSFEQRTMLHTLHDVVV
jgi:hypothetical protein